MSSPETTTDRLPARSPHLLQSSSMFATASGTRVMSAFSASRGPGWKTHLRIVTVGSLGWVIEDGGRIRREDRMGFAGCVFVCVDIDRDTWRKTRERVCRVGEHGPTSNQDPEHRHLCVHEVDVDHLAFQSKELMVRGGTGLSVGSKVTGPAGVRTLSSTKVLRSVRTR